MSISSAPRRALASAAIAATSVAASLSGLAGAAHAASAGDAASPLTISFGTTAVQVGSADTTFGSTVTDAVWSPDGSRIAYVDGNGDIVNAAPDGTDVVVLTTAAAGTKRAHPTWEDGGAEIIFSESVNGGAWKLMTVDAGGMTLGKPTVEQAVGETSADTVSDTNPDAFFSDPATGQPGNKLVYEHAGASGPEVWILDRNTRGPQGAKLTAGTQPSIAPDGSAVAFVDAAGQIETVALPVPVVNNAPAPVFTKITNDAAKHFDHPTWSPDGKTLAFEGLTSNGATPTALWTGVDTETAPASGGATPAVVATRGPNVPAYRPVNRKLVHRIAGPDRIQTAVEASKAVWPTAGTPAAPGQLYAQNVVLSRSDQFADALGGSALASMRDAPLLLTPTAALRDDVKAEIVRVLGPVNAQYPQTVYLLGGTSALSPAVETSVQALGYKVVRLGASDRYGTSVAIASSITSSQDGTSTWSPQRIMVATGVNFADALSAGAAAQGGVVVLTADTTMPAATAAYLNKYHYDGSAGSVPVFAIGGQANTALQSVGFGSSARQYTDVHGANRYATSLLVAQEFFDGPTKVGFATGLSWADALSGGAMMGTVHGPVLLTDPVTGPSVDALAWLGRNAPQFRTALVFGGPNAVGTAVDGKVGTAISGPGGYDENSQPIVVPVY